MQMVLQKTRLWFDVGIKRYTTRPADHLNVLELWFDVGIKRYTTSDDVPYSPISCGLM